MMGNEIPVELQSQDQNWRIFIARLEAALRTCIINSSSKVEWMGLRIRFEIDQKPARIFIQAPWAEIPSEESPEMPLMELSLKISTHTDIKCAYSPVGLDSAPHRATLAITTKDGKFSTLAEALQPILKQNSIDLNYPTQLRALERWGTGPTSTTGR